jgi:class 3 adenylate cyclase
MAPKPGEGRSGEEPRYDTETLGRVTALAQRLQTRQEDTLTVREMETIGAEVGLQPAFIHQALSELTPRTTSVEVRRPASEPTRTRALARAWWASAWTLVLASIGLTGGPGSEGPASMIYFFLALGAYIGVGCFLSSLSSTPEPQPARLSRTALLQALFTLQITLEQQKQHRAFLSVDVVGSSDMKRSAPEIAVEYSFGRFRDWVNEIVRASGGEMQSAAGDGMMCVFPDDGSAVRAARLLQEGLQQFNVDENRLPAPFRIRCGISAGDVPVEEGMPLGHLNSLVVDRAAALQKQAAPGDIVVSAEVAPAALRELDSLARLPQAADEPAFSWRAGQG